MISNLILFFLSFMGFAYSASPSLPAYRDAGEMVTALSFLGVAHPPGYPLYTLLGRFALYLPFGTAAYRLNLFSALCGALAVVLLYRFLRGTVSHWPAAIASLFLAASHPFWELSAVPEMYALGVLWLVLLLMCAFQLKNENLFGFLMGLGLGVRMDMMLLVPVFLVWFVQQKGFSVLWRIALFGTIGLSVFLYLPIRSLQDPLMDWGNPDSLQALFNSLSRKSYGGTLDLLSLSYGKGDNFGVNMELYARHLISTFGWWGGGLMAAGCAALLRARSQIFPYIAAFFIITCPVYLFLANMPPNPHAKAIIEAGYLVPDVMMILVAAVGMEWFVSGSYKKPAIALLLVAAVANVSHGYPIANKRSNFYLRDYVESVFRSAPRSALVVFHEDVQLFSLWESALLTGRRPDLSFLSTGLSNSHWFREMVKRWRRPEVPEVSLKDSSAWKFMKEELRERPLVIGYETDAGGSDPLVLAPQGLMVELRSPNNQLPINFALLPALCSFRNPLRYFSPADFFSSDLISDIARAAHQYGFYEMMNNADQDRAKWFLRWAVSMDPTFPRATSDLAYLYLKNGDYAQAFETYRSAIGQYEAIMEKTKEFRTLPAVVRSYKSDLALTVMHAGVAKERMGQIEEARNYYQQSLQIMESPAAHYNLAITFWEKDWRQAILHLRRSLELNSNQPQVQAALYKANQMAAQRYDKK